MPFSIKLLLQLNLNKPSHCCPKNPLFEAFWGKIQKFPIVYHLETFKDQDGFFNLCNHLINEGPVDI